MADNCPVLLKLLHNLIAKFVVVILVVPRSVLTTPPDKVFPKGDILDQIKDQRQADAPEPDLMWSEHQGRRGGSFSTNSGVLRNFFSASLLSSVQNILCKALMSNSAKEGC